MDTQTEELEQQVLPAGEPVVFLAGRIEGLAFSNIYAQFRAAQLKLEAQGFNVLNPVECIEPIVESTQCQRKQIMLLCKSDFIYIMPGWEKSDSATLLRSLAIKLNMPDIYA
jgi:hypothetical protein